MMSAKCCHSTNYVDKNTITVNEGFVRRDIKLVVGSELIRKRRKKDIHFDHGNRCKFTIMFYKTITKSITHY